MTALIDRNVISFSNRDAQGVMTALIDRNDIFFKQGCARG